MKLKNPILLIIVFTIIIFIVGVLVMSSSNSTVPIVKASESSKAYTVDPTSFDWGNIAYSGPKKTKSFTIKNTGTDILKLYNIRTSCHCTDAYLTIDGQDSPEFGMDMGGSISSYVGEVKPNKEAKLTVVFDPAYHGPSGIGPVTRYVEVDTNDKSLPKLTFTLTGNVIK